jgi:hypothetical protein
MRRAIPCRACGAAIEAVWTLFRHEPVCRWADDLRQRERVARQKAWQLQERLNRLERQLARR